MRKSNKLIQVMKNILKSGFVKSALLDATQVGRSWWDSGTVGQKLEFASV
jgi:hypothetical protein